MFRSRVSRSSLSFRPRTRLQGYGWVEMWRMYEGKWGSEGSWEDEWRSGGREGGGGLTCQICGVMFCGGGDGLRLERMGGCILTGGRRSRV